MGGCLAKHLQRRKGARAIIFGAGLMGRHHARAAASAAAAIAAVVDQDPSAAAALAACWPGAIAETDPGRAVRAAGGDVAHICTPLASHGAIADAVADAGLHALIEKPLAANAPEVRRIHEAFARSGKLACPAHQYAFQGSVSDAAAWLAGAGSGAIRRIAFDICSAGAANGLDPDAVIADILPHPLSVVQKLLPGADLAELEWAYLRPAAGEWLVSAPVDGAALVIQLSMKGRPTRFMTRITADHGTMELDNFHDFAVAWAGKVSRGAKIVQPFQRSGLGLLAAGMNLAARTARREFAYPGLQTLVGEFYRAAGSGGAVPPPVTAQQSIAVAEARDRIIALAAHG